MDVCKKNVEAKQRQGLGGRMVGGGGREGEEFVG